MSFTIEETVWIALGDGTRLAATIWRPEGTGPFPAVLEYLPYRRRDSTAMRDDSTYPAFAAAGIAGVRVDSRGQGDSQGIFDDEYSPTELADAAEVIAWIAARPWSNGAVGMMGISWGGFNALQVAARRPPALKAVISIASTTDRFADDIHYKGGAMLSANVSWAAVMLSYASRPPDPEVVGPDWPAIWRARLDTLPMLLERWLDHQHRDDYWRHGSVCEDWGAIDIPVWIIAGWADGYRNTPAKLAAHARHPVKALTGPWVHKYPHFAWPGPRADFLGLAIDWWRAHLAGEARGTAGWPGHAVWLGEANRPGPGRARDAGRWVDAARAEIVETAWNLGADLRFGGPAGPVTIATPQHCGIAGGSYFCTAAEGADMALDQTPDDRLSVCWEHPLDAPLDLIGAARVEIPLAIDRDGGNLVARLVDVHPDGTAALIARGVLNLCHRESHAAPGPMQPGKVARVTLTLDHMAYRLRAGHRLRLALSTAYWPMVLPPPSAVTATVTAGAEARLVLPVARTAPPCDIPEPPGDTFPVYEVLEPGSDHRGTERDPVTGQVRHVIAEDGPWLRHPRNAMEWRETHHETWTIDPQDPATCHGTLVLTAERRRPGWQTATEARIVFTCHPDRFSVDARLEATADGAPFATRDWTFEVPRRMV